MLQRHLAIVKACGLFHEDETMRCHHNLMQIFFQEIADLYQEKGDLQYHGENVTQLVHAWQCGQLAKQQGASPELQMAAWLHDIGHLLTGQAGTPTVVGIDDQHQVLGSHYLAQKLPPAVVQPVALHVLAKRYLVSTNRDYQAQLGGAAGAASGDSSAPGLDPAALAKTLALLKSADAKDKKSLAAAVEAAIAGLELAGTFSAPDVLSPVLASLPSLAKELGKEAPVVHLHDHGLRLHREAADLLKNVGAHLLRNSMDHGIETPDVRTAAGKSAAGHIHFNMQVKDDGLKLRLHDDGKGLDLAAIWAKAMQKAVVPADAELTSSEIAQLIFVPGFSTASAVTEVSGRGVGMDAVKSFVESAGGTISLVLLDEHMSLDQVPFETVITLPSRLAVKVG
jgi:predicted HD phosphohydrolase